MGKRISIDERIVKVRNDRYELLSMVSDSIKNNRNILISDIKNLSDVLEYDEKTIKRYEAVVKAQELIASLTEEICYAQTAEEIIELRKKINSCINKIKNELKRRNVSEECLIKYQESANYLRKDIAKFIRVIKREDNITNIDNLYKTYETMTDEEKIQFKKMVGREYRYNQRNLNPKVPKQSENKIEEPITLEIDNNEEKSEIISLEFINNNSIPEKIALEVQEEPTVLDSKKEIIQNGVITESLGENILSFEIGNDLPEETLQITTHDELKKEDLSPEIIEQIEVRELNNPVNRVVNSISDIEESDIEFLKIRIKSYDNRYNIREPYDYGNSIINRISSVIKNIPIYKANKKTIKQMIIESKIGSKKSSVGSDFISYIAYLTKINSIKHGLKTVFSRSYLYSSEGQLLNDHEKCVDWIIDFCEKNSLQVDFLNRTLIR